MEFKNGDIFHLRKGPGKPYKCHVRGIVDNHIVYCWYGRHKQWWHYNIEYKDTLKMQVKHGREFQEKLEKEKFKNG